MEELNLFENNETKSAPWGNLAQESMGYTPARTIFNEPEMSKKEFFIESVYKGFSDNFLSSAQSFASRKAVRYAEEKFGASPLTSEQVKEEYGEEYSFVKNPTRGYLDYISGQKENRDRRDRLLASYQKDRVLRGEGPSNVLPIVGNLLGAVLDPILWGGAIAISKGIGAGFVYTGFASASTSGVATRLGLSVTLNGLFDGALGFWKQQEDIARGDKTKVNWGEVGFDALIGAFVGGAVDFWGTRGVKQALKTEEVKLLTTGREGQKLIGKPGQKLIEARQSIKLEVKKSKHEEFLEAEPLRLKDDWKVGKEAERVVKVLESGFQGKVVIGPVKDFGFYKKMSEEELIERGIDTVEEIDGNIRLGFHTTADGLKEFRPKGYVNPSIETGTKILNEGKTTTIGLSSPGEFSHYLNFSPNELKKRGILSVKEQKRGIVLQFESTEAGLKELEKLRAKALKEIDVPSSRASDFERSIPLEGVGGTPQKVLPLEKEKIAKIDLWERTAKDFTDLKKAPLGREVAPSRQIKRSKRLSSLVNLGMDMSIRAYPERFVNMMDDTWRKLEKFKETFSKSPKYKEKYPDAFDGFGEIMDNAPDLLDEGDFFEFFGGNIDELDDISKILKKNADESPILKLEDPLKNKDSGKILQFKKAVEDITPLVDTIDEGLSVIESSFKVVGEQVEKGATKTSGEGKVLERLLKLDNKINSLVAEKEVKAFNKGKVK